MTWYPKLHLVTLTVGLVGLWAPFSLAQTSPTSTFDAKTVDIFDTTEGQSFDPLDIIHKANFAREDPFSFFQRQQNNLNSEFSNFRNRQLEQLREQGYEPPSLAIEESEATPGAIPPGAISPDVDPSLQFPEPEPILRIDLPKETSVNPASAPETVQENP